MKKIRLTCVIITISMIVCTSLILIKERHKTKESIVLQVEPEECEDMRDIGNDAIEDAPTLEVEASPGIEEGVRIIEEDTFEPIELIFGGDICFYDDFAIMGALRSRGGSIDSSIDANLLALMRNADFCMLNNEFCYSNRGEPLEEKAYTFRSRPENVKLLHEMGVTLVSLANNHAFDYGEDAFLDTLDILSQANVPYVGAGRNLDEAMKPYYTTIHNRTIAIVAATQIERVETPDTKGATEVTAGTFRCFTKAEFDRLCTVVEDIGRAHV